MTETDKIIKELEAGLDKDSITWRNEGWGNKQISIPYLTSEYAISQANRIFGHFGWKYRVTRLETCADEIKTKEDRDGGPGKQGWDIGIAATLEVSVWLPERSEWITREDIGYGSGVDYSSKAKAAESAGKEAISDALKRALRTFGDQFGNCLYNKEYRDNLSQGGGSSKPAATSQHNNAPSGGGNKGGYTSGKPLQGAASDAQKGAIERMLKKAGKTLTEFGYSDMSILTKQQASDLIGALQN